VAFVVVAISMAAAVFAAAAAHAGDTVRACLKIPWSPAIFKQALGILAAQKLGRQRKSLFAACGSRVWCLRNSDDTAISKTPQ
jgi:hypothetical protein